MKVNYIKKENTDKNIKILSQEIRDAYGYSMVFCELLARRGIKKDEVPNFLSPSLDIMTDPLIFSGVTEAVKRIKEAVSLNQSVVIYGDYDCDGICATQILMSYFKNNDVEVNFYIPSREEGYGINIESIDYIAETYFPDLLITCDLGISCSEEIEYIVGLGIDVIVTDHHELPKVLPDCICINPKLDKDKGLFSDYCGAGVALKLVSALTNNVPKEALCYAAIATIADSVPLILENRAIVKLGLLEINSNPPLQIKELIDSAGVKGNISSGQIAFLVAPRINAAGRMGNPSRMVEYFNEEDDERLKAVCVEIGEENSKRQRLTDDIFNECVNMFLKEGATQRAIVLYNKNWQHGVLGIVASRLTEAFYRPVILFSQGEGDLKGSCRSIAGINILNVLNDASKHIERFGGHEFAAGLSIKENNYEAFRTAVQNAVESFDIDVFLPKYYYDVDLTNENLSNETMEEIKHLEPFGMGNYKPTFIEKTDTLQLSEMSSSSNHFVGQIKDRNYVAFNFSDKVLLFNENVAKTMVIEPTVSEFGGKKQFKYLIKNVLCNNVLAKNNDYYSYLFNEIAKQDLKLVPKDALQRLVTNSRFSALLIATTAEKMKSYLKVVPSENVLFENYQIFAGTNINRLLYAPKNFTNFDKFNIIITDSEITSKYNLKSQQKLFAFKDDMVDYAFKNVSLNRDEFVKYYKVFASLDKMKACSYIEFLSLLNKYDDILEEQMMFCLCVFCELKVVAIENGIIAINKNIKTDLEKSNIYLRNYNE